jgi:plasmid segregation protein ParM
MKIAIDVGYGDVKVKTEDKLFKFTNAISFVSNATVNYESDLNVFKYNGDEYLVGDEALSRKPFITRDFNYLSEFAPLLVYKALKMAGATAEDEIQLITGLSLKDWDKASQFGKVLTSIFVNDEHFKIKPSSIKLVPQGKGVYLDYKSTHEITGENDYLAIVDIGYNTFDFLVFKDGRTVKEYNYANTNGVNAIVTEVSKLLSRDYPVTFSEQEIKELLQTRQVRIGSQTHDISTLIQKEVSRYCKLTKNEIQTKNPELLHRAYKIVISGGGAHILADNKISMFEHQDYCSTPHEFANVRGYYMELSNND